MDTMIGELDWDFVLIALVTFLFAFVLLICTHLLDSGVDRAFELIHISGCLAYAIWESCERVDLWRNEPTGILKSLYSGGPPSMICLSPLLSTASAQYSLEDEWAGIVLGFCGMIEDICTQTMALLVTRYQTMTATFLYDPFRARCLRYLPMARTLPRDGKRETLQNAFLVVATSIYAIPTALHLFSDLAPFLSVLALLRLPCSGRSLSLHINITSNNRVQYRVSTLQETFLSAMISTWFLWAHLTLILAEINGDVTPAIFFLTLFLVEQFRYVEIARHIHRNQRQGCVWKWDLVPVAFSLLVDPVTNRRTY